MTPASMHFREWIRLMGLHGKQVMAGAKLIGITNVTTASSTFTGKRKLKETERLAMSAIRLGLKPWTPEYDAELIELASALHLPTGVDGSQDPDSSPTERPDPEPNAGSQSSSNAAAA